MIVSLQPVVALLSAAGAIRALSPESLQAHAILDLGIATAIVLALIFAVVIAIVVYAQMRFRWQEGEPDPNQMAGNKAIEIVWTAIPFTIVVALFLLAAP